MQQLIIQIKELKNNHVGSEIKNRLKEFKAQQEKGNKAWFSELCFCLLAANTSSFMASKMQEALGYEGFTHPEGEKAIVRLLNDQKCRFYNRRGHFIAVNNIHKNIKTKLVKQKDKRAWLVENIKGFGYKEASHFLRNVGHFDHAILDKHVLNIMKEQKMVKTLPKSMNPKFYLKFEKRLLVLAKELKMTQGELDMYLWYLKTGKVLK